jgi:hypothetical protein
MFNQKEYKKKWDLAHPGYQKKWRLKNRKHREEYSKKWRDEHPGYDKKQYCLHREKRQTKRRNFYSTHQKQGVEYAKQYREAYPEEVKQRTVQWKQGHREEIKTYNKQYRQQPAGKENHRKGEAKRRSNFGFIPLNKYFEGSRSHHVDRERVIYIPTKLHESIRHSVTQNRNMYKMNEAAFNFLNGGENGAR